MIKPSLRWEIITTLTIAMVASSFLISLVVMSITKRSIVGQKVKDTKTLIGFLQHSIDSVSYGNDKLFHNDDATWQLQRLVTLFTQEREVKSIVITDRSGRVIASNEPASIGTSVHDTDLKKVMHTEEILTRATKARQSMFRQITEELSISAPLFIKNRVVGAIRMKLSLSDMQHVFSTSLRIIVFYIIFTSVLIIVFGSYLLSRVVVRPLQKLVRATEAIGRGDFHHPHTDGGRDEVGQLSLAFNRMTERINEHQKELRSKIKSLESLNRELQQSQKEVLAGEKLAMVGKLSAGIAHEIGNPLSAVLGYINLLKKKGSQAPDVLDYLSRMEQELLRINRTIRGLLDFSRLEKAEITRVDMRQVLEACLRLVAHQEAFRTIKVYTHIDDKLWLVEGDSNQFQQVLLNLLLNASAAVAKDGSVAVLADRMTWQDGMLVTNAPSPALETFSGTPHFSFADETIPWEGSLAFVQYQPVLRIVVADNGAGIAAEHFAKIFDPFFTTKAPGEGTGLGLAICARIIESCGGVISVRSQEGKGTAFIILLPGREY